MPKPGDDTINERLGKYGRFGVHLGLERIQRLLKALGNPEARVPIVHVGGTNGKGSVCAYLSSVLAAAGYRVGRYTSPHLVSWCERICINNKPVAPDALDQVIQQAEAAIAPEHETPTQFEVLTAAAWLYFAQQSVDLAVIEVGLGGRLDATNVINQPLVSVITSLSREHWQRLGPTLADIAGEKAGILKQQRPAVIGPLPAEAETVILNRAHALNCPSIRPPAVQIDAEGYAIYPFDRTPPDLRYTVPFPGDHQLTNSAIAIAALQCLRDQGWQILPEAIQTGLASAQWPGRLQWLTWQPPDQQRYPLLIDGAHNPAAAKVLRAYVDDILQPQPTPFATRSLHHWNISAPAQGPVTWLMGMLATKDHADVFRELLRPGDRLHLLPVPDHASMEPEALQAIAISVCPTLAIVQTHPTLNLALDAITNAPSPSPSAPSPSPSPSLSPSPPERRMPSAECQTPLNVLCGSLYLVGHFLQTQAVNISMTR